MVGGRQRAVLFVDGSNFYHSVKATGVTEPGRLDFAKLGADCARACLDVATGDTVIGFL